MVIITQKCAFFALKVSLICCKTFPRRRLRFSTVDFHFRRLKNILINFITGEIYQNKADNENNMHYLYFEKERVV